MLVRSTSFETARLRLSTPSPDVFLKDDVGPMGCIRPLNARRTSP